MRIRKCWYRQFCMLLRHESEYDLRNPQIRRMMYLLRMQWNWLNWRRLQMRYHVKNTFSESETTRIQCGLKKFERFSALWVMEAHQLSLNPAFLWKIQSCKGEEAPDVSELTSLSDFPKSHWYGHLVKSKSPVKFVCAWAAYCEGFPYSLCHIID